MRMKNQKRWKAGEGLGTRLHVEHLNRIAKELGLGTNKKKGVMKVVGTITPLLANFDEENCIATPAGVHHAPHSKDRILS